MEPIVVIEQDLFDEAVRVWIEEHSTEETMKGATFAVLSALVNADVRRSELIESTNEQGEPSGKYTYHWECNVNEVIHSGLFDSVNKAIVNLFGGTPVENSIVFSISMNTENIVDHKIKALMIETGLEERD